jgi:hypothetical protein
MLCQTLKSFIDRLIETETYTPINVKERSLVYQKSMLTDKKKEIIFIKEQYSLSYCEQQ